MEHTDAVRTNAVERYLLDEMSEEERAIFEEHFFECGHCVAAINAGTQLMIAGKAVALEDREKPQAAENVVPFRKRWRWIPQAAAATLLLMIGAQLPRVAQFVKVAQVEQHEQPDGLRPGPARVVAVAVEATRGGEEMAPAGDVEKVRPGDSIYFPVPADELAESYRATIRDPRGKSHGVVTISREQVLKPAVFLEIGELPVGSYELVIESARKGGKHVKVASGVIEVERVER